MTSLFIAVLFLGQVSGTGGGGGDRIAHRPNAGPPVAEPVPVKPEDRCAVEGNVSDHASGAPVKKATLTLRRMDVTGAGPPMTYSGVSDAAGHFVIPGIEPGSYRLFAERTSYVNQQYGARTPSGPGTVLTLGKAQTMKDVNIKLVPHGVITGRVLDEDGDPVANASLQVMRSMYIRGKKQWAPMNGSNSNDLGEYRVFGLAPGRYILSATYRPMSMGAEVRSGASETYAPTYYPGSISPDSAAAIDVTPGAQLRGADIRMQKARAVSVRGRIVNGVTGGPVQNVMIAIMPKGDAVFNMMGRSISRPYNERGEFVVNSVLPGSYSLTANVNEDGKLLSARVPIDVGTSPIEGILLQLNPGVDLTGRVNIPDAQRSGLRRLRLALQPKMAVMIGGGAQGGMVREDGTFSFTNVQPELYEIRIIGLPDGGYVRSIRMGDAQVLETGIDFTNGAAPAEIAVDIAMDAGEITGTVQNEKSEPASSATVVLIPEGKRRELDFYYRVSNTDQNGAFKLRNIAPGEYRAFAFDSLESGSYQDPEWLKPFESKGERISIKEGAKENLKLNLVVTAP